MPMLSQLELAERMPRLPPLSVAGCGVPLVALARARYLRQRTLEILWQEMLGDDERERLLALVCTRPDAHWWCQPNGQTLLMCVRALLMPPASGRER